MNYALVTRLLSMILASIGAAMLLSAGVGYLYIENEPDKNALLPFCLSVVIVFVIAVVFYALGHKKEQQMFHKEALCVIGTGWILASLVGALPYFLVLPDCSLIDAIFESTSGFTTTGSSVFTNLETFPRSLLFWRGISQWIGGLGVVVFFIAILSSVGAGAKILFSKEFSSQATEVADSRIQSGVLIIIAFYLGFSLICALTLKILGMDWYEAICHMFTTLSTAGFSTRSGSIGAFDSPAIDWAIICFMIIGATSFLVIIRILRRDWQEVWNNTETYCYYGILFFGILLTSLILFQENPDRTAFNDTFRKAFFQAVSLITTTGFTTANYDNWSPLIHILFIIFMVIGGSSGSTAGGLKVVRLLIAVRICLLNIEKAFRSRVVRLVKINGRTLTPTMEENVMSYLVLAGIIYFLSIPFIAFLEPQMSLKGTFSAVTAHLFNIGPGFAEVGPTHNYAFLSDYTKIVLSLLMIMGRLEFYAILVLFVPSFWKRLA